MMIFQRGGHDSHGCHGRHGMRHGGGFGGRGFGGGGGFSVRWGGDDDGRGGGRGPGRGRRMFDAGELRLVLLKLIEEQPRHGYDLIRAIEALTGGDYAPSPGVVYPTLTMLADMGLIEEVAAEGSRKAARRAWRGCGSPPLSARNASPACGPLTRTIAIPAGGAPLDSAKMESIASDGSGVRHVALVRSLARLARAFHEALEQLHSHLPHRRELLGVFLHLVDAAGALHRLGESLDVNRVGFFDIGQPHETARFVGRAFDLDIDLHRGSPFNRLRAPRKGLKELI